MRAVLALDQGTSQLARDPVRPRGRGGPVAQREFRQNFPGRGWVEHDADEIWRRRSRWRRGARQRRRRGRPSRRHRHHQPARDDRGLGARRRPPDPPRHRLAGSPHRRPLRRAARRRAPGAADARATGLVLDPYFSATKVGGCSTTCPGARARAEAGELAFGTIDSFLVWRLTGDARVHVTDVTNASRTLLIDLRHAASGTTSMLAAVRRPARAAAAMVGVGRDGRR